MDNKELKSYISSFPVSLVLGLLFAGFGIMGLFVDVAKPVGLMLAMFGIAAICLIVFFVGKSNLNKLIEQYESQYGADVLMKDFSSAHSLLADKIRLGDGWLYGSKTGTVIRYEQIRKIYIYIHKTNGVEDRRALKIVTSDGKTRELCLLPTTGFVNKQNHPDVETVIKVLLIKNPNVHIGYK
ncbi:MAG: hypothetical protein IKK75_06965 [Clostridia bacterium]|nr:hypothetical protein [Clostridia bacterium]